MLNIGGVHLKNPLIVGSGPITRNLDMLEEADRAGAAAASIKLTLIRQPFPAELRLYTDRRLGMVLSQDKRLELREAQALIREAKRRTGLILMANMTHSADDVDGWIELARSLQDAGADMIEANFVCGNIGFASVLAGDSAPVAAGALIGQDADLARQLTAALKEALSIPLVCKLTSSVTDITKTAVACTEGGADALTIGGGGGPALPPIDVYHPGRSPYPLADGVTFGGLVGPAGRTHTYAGVARVYRAADIPIIGCGGLQTWEHGVQCMMWGGTFISVCTSIMWYGFEVITKILRGMDRFIEEEGYGSYEGLIGKAQPLIRSAQELVYVRGAALVDSKRCDGCGICTKPGHCHAVTLVDDKAIVDPKLCLGCAICASLCPRQAITMTPFDAQS